MAIRDQIPSLGAAGANAANRTAKSDGAALWERFTNRTTEAAAKDRETAISQTLASSTTPTLLHEHLQVN